MAWGVRDSFAVAVKPESLGRPTGEATAGSRNNIYTKHTGKGVRRVKQTLG